MKEILSCRRSTVVKLKPLGISPFLLLLGMAAVPLVPQSQARPPEAVVSSESVDWLIDGRPYKSTTRTDSSGQLVIGNGLMERVFRTTPNCATVGYNNLMTGESEIRAVRPEAVVTIDGKEYSVGGLTGQPVNNYLSPDFLDTMKTDPNAFIYESHKVEKTVERFPWKKNPQWLSTATAWPAPGTRVTFTYKAPPTAPDKLRNTTINIVYELYDGAPILSKKLEITNKGTSPVTLNSFKAEILAMTDTAPKVHYGEPHEIRMLAQPPGTYTKNYRKSPVQTDAPRDYIDRFTQLFVVTDYAMGGDMEAMKDNPAVRWVFDHPEYEYTGIRYYGQYKPARLETTLPIGPNTDIAPGDTWKSFTTFEMMRDSTDRERRGLAECKFWRMMSPWVQENPVFMHVRNVDPAVLRNVIDQCAEVGFEMVIMTFGSGFNIENTDPGYLESMKEIAGYAKAKGIAIGGYSLLASRGAKDADAAISPKTGKPAVSREEGSRFGKSPCLASEWGDTYFDRLRNYFITTGMNVFENDGSYPGDTCASHEHSGHKGYEDSQWKQWNIIKDFYHWCRSNGIYLNVPDWYFLSGSSKTPMGYVETNWSLPRAQQEIIERQNIYDGTWQKSPTMGFMFVPLTQYHGGGAAATIEPLDEHRDHYEQRLKNLFGAGVQACYRGPRIYDTDRTRDLVKKWVSFYKKYRPILDSDIIHLRRPDGQDWDGIMHVNPSLKQKGFISLYNPLDKEITRKIRIPLYYTGLTDYATLKKEDLDPIRRRLNRDYSITLDVTFPPKGYVWYTVE